jgi:hypothetical protein
VAKKNKAKRAKKKTKSKSLKVKKPEVKPLSQRVSETSNSALKVYNYNNIVKGAFILLLLFVLMAVLAFFLESLNVEKPVLWRWMMYSTLMVCGVPLWVNTKSYTHFKREHEKVKQDIAVIEQKLGRNRLQDNYPNF